MGGTRELTGDENTQPHPLGMITQVTSTCNIYEALFLKCVYLIVQNLYINRRRGRKMGEEKERKCEHSKYKTR